VFKRFLATRSHEISDQCTFRTLPNLWVALCSHFDYYNFCRIHKKPPRHPAMQAGITDRIWDIAELLV